MIVNLGFAFYLTLAVLISGLIAALDKFVLEKRRRVSGKRISMVAEYARALFPVLLAVLIIRSFVIQFYRVPTGSLEPTVMPGDWILVNQYKYGLRLPITNTKIVNVSDPKRGDIVLFYYPPDPQQIYVKRLIGEPGDHVIYKNKQLTINGQPIEQALIKMDTDFGNRPGEARRVKRIKENLLGVKHEIFVQPQGGEVGDFDITVPKGHYFMMGDNRDNSADSRMWGFVPEANIIGKAEYVIFNWDPVHHRPVWHRIGNKLSVGATN